MSVDWFNPLTTKQAGKKPSVGVVSLVCLKLPTDKHYKLENMFLAGIIPGPHEPSLDAVNHFLTPIVDDFLDFWDPGVFFDRTHNCPDGRRVRCALVIVICDLLAARKIAGFTAVSHNLFCSRCHCNRRDPGLNDFNFLSWKPRTNEECRRCADQYRSASTSSIAQSVVDRTGMRWSELLRLPYFDITKFVVVDSMHNLFLGLLKDHFRNVLGFRPDPKQHLPMHMRKTASSDILIDPLADDFDPAVIDLMLPPVPENMSSQERRSLDRLVKWLKCPLCQVLQETEGFAAFLKRFNRQHKAALIFIARSIELSVPGGKQKLEDCGKAVLAEKILKWVRTTSSDPSGTKHSPAFRSR